MISGSILQTPLQVKRSSQRVISGRDGTLPHPHHTHTHLLENPPSSDGDCRAKMALGFSFARKDEFLSQCVLQPNGVLLLSRNSTVPIIDFAVEFNVKIQEWAFSFLLQFLGEALQVH